MLFVSSFLLSLSSSGGHRSSFQIIVPEMYTPRRSSFAGMSILDPVPRPARPGVLATMGWRQRRRGPVEVANSPSSHTGFCAPNKLHGKKMLDTRFHSFARPRQLAATRPLDSLLHRQLPACPQDSVSPSSITPPPPRSFPSENWHPPTSSDQISPHSHRHPHSLACAILPIEDLAPTNKTSICK
jgi:hypothetical protein